MVKSPGRLKNYTNFTKYRITYVRGGCIKITIGLRIYMFICMINLHSLEITVRLSHSQDLMHSYHVWPSQAFVYRVESYGLQDFGVLRHVQGFHIRSL